MHNLLAFFKLIFKHFSLIKSLRKKFHFFEIHISTSILQVCFECALSVPQHFRTIFSTQRSNFVVFEKSWKCAFCSIFAYQLRIFHFFFQDRPIWSNQHWNFKEWTQEMLSHTYHAPISYLHLIFEFAKKNFHFFIFMHISLSGTSQSSLRSFFQRFSNFFFIEF